MIKRIALLISVFLLVSVLSMLLVLPANAEIYSGNCGAEGDGSNLTWVLSEDGHLTISGSGPMRDYSTSYSGLPPWNGWRTSITEVTLPEEATNIGSGAFYKCENLVKINIPKCIRSIGSHAFTGCTSLTCVDISDIAAWCNLDFTYAYYENPLWRSHTIYVSGELVTDLVIPEGVTKIGKLAFCNCTGITSVMIPSTVETIDEYAFNGCNGLREISLSASTAIGKEAFGILSNDFPSYEDEQYLYNRAFHVTLDDDTVMQEWCYGGCPIQSLAGRYYLYDKNETAIQVLEIPEECAEVADYSFRGCAGLTSVIIPDSVTTIGQGAFMGCSSLERIFVGMGIDSINSEAFASCSNLTEIFLTDLPAWCSVTYKESYGYDEEGQALYRDENPFYNISNGGYNLYLNGELLTELTISEGISEFGLSFKGCKSLTDVTIPGTVTDICDRAFLYCTGLTNLTIQNGVINIGENAFSGCGLKQVSIPASVRTIGTGAFSSVEKLTLDMPIISAWFQNSSNLKAVALTGNVQSIGSNAFAGCTGLTNIMMPNSIATIGANAFAGCTVLNSITIPNSVKTLGIGAFSNCTGLSTLTMGNGITTIGNQAFSGCTHLTELTIPASVTSFGSNVFEGCTFLHELTIEMPEITRGMLDCCYSQLSDVTITDPNCLIEYEVNTLGVPGQTVIHGAEGSTAQKYAERFSYQFEIYTPKPQVVFGDVPENAYYAAPVAWAVENGVTNGTGEGKFSPEATCTRGQIVTFLWRAKGSPEPVSTDNPFTDVSADAYYYKAVLWARENNITSGTAADKFSPNAGCTRAQVVTFLWRTEGEPEPEATNNPFADVTGGYYYKAVLWAVEQKITNGTSATTFGPDATCTRGQIVTFLYRDLA